MCPCPNICLAAVRSPHHSHQRPPASLVAAVVAHDPEAYGTLIFLTSVTRPKLWRKKSRRRDHWTIYEPEKHIRSPWALSWAQKSMEFYKKWWLFNWWTLCRILPTENWCEPSELQCPSRERPSKGVFTRILVGPPKKMAGTPVSFKKFWVITHIYNPGYMWIHMTYDSYDTYYTLW